MTFFLFFNKHAIKKILSSFKIYEKQQFRFTPSLSRQ